MHGEERLRVGKAESRFGELLASGHRVFAAWREGLLSIFRPVAYELERLEWFARRGLERWTCWGDQVEGSWLRRELRKGRT